MTFSGCEIRNLKRNIKGGGFRELVVVLGIPAAGRGGGHAFRLYACKALHSRPGSSSIVNTAAVITLAFLFLNNKVRRPARHYLLA